MARTSGRRRKRVSDGLKFAAVALGAAGTRLTGRNETPRTWAFRGVCPSSFHFLSLSIYSKTYTEVSDPFYPGYEFHLQRFSAADLPRRLGRRFSNLQKVFFERDRDGLCAVGGVELGEDEVDVLLDGICSDFEGFCDVSVCESSDHVGEYLKLARG